MSEKKADAKEWLVRDFCELKKNDPVVAHSIRMFEMGICDWESALLNIIVTLARGNKRTREMILESEMMNPKPIVKRKESQ